MEMLYSAYGLQLSCSYPLPGMRDTARVVDALPILKIVMVDQAQLEHSWSGTSDPPEWRGRQGDGRDLVLERGSAGDLLFSYGDLARLRLDPKMRQLECTPSEPGMDWQRVLLSKVIPTISVMLGHEGLHAAALDAPAGVVAIMAPSGTGKSTLALELLRRDWPLFADDVLTLSHASSTVNAHPGTPHMNIALDLPETIDLQPLGETIAILSGERWFAASNVADDETRPVQMLCLLERGPGLALAIETLTASPLPLAPYTLGLSNDPERLRSRFDLYADLTASTTLVRLTADPGHRPEQLADLLESAIAAKPKQVAGAPR